MKYHKQIAISYLVILTTSLIGCLYLLTSKPHFGTNILDLLPTIHRDPVTEQVLTSQAAELGKRIVLIVQSPTERSAEVEALRLADELVKSDLFAQVDPRISARDLQPLVDLFLRHPFQLAPLTDSDTSPATTHAIIEAATQRAFSPDSVQWLHSADKDPLLLLPTFIDSLFSSGGRFTVRNGFIHVDTPTSRNIVIIATLKGTAYAQETQEAATRFLDGLSVSPPSSLLTSGVILFAAESASRTRAEVSIITSATTVCVIALLFFAFRSFRSVLLITGYVTSCFAGALFISYLGATAIQGMALHLLTIGFGSCLIGICVDYAVHYIVAHATTTPEDTRAPLSRIASGLILGLLTSIVGFLGIAFSPFPGLQQLALFCVSGLCIAAGAVTLLFPRLSGAPRLDRGVTHRATRSMGLLSQRTSRVALFALVVLLTLGLPHSKVVDDIRVLNIPSPELIRRQRAVAELVGMTDGGTVVTVEGASEEEVLQREETIVKRLRQLITTKQLDSFRAISTVIPSQQTQKLRYTLIASLVRDHPDDIQQLVSSLHLPPAAHVTLTSTLAGTPEAYPQVQECITSGACRTVRELWLGKMLGRYVTTIPLNGFKGDPTALSAGVDGIRVVNHADAISHALALYRLSATELTALFYCLILGLLVWRYGMAHALRVTLPSLAGVLASIAALGIIGVPINVFSVFALMVLLGISIDYAIFFAEDGHHSPATTYAVILSAATTILSFGALAFSSTPALQSFGIVLSVGVLFSALLAPLAQRAVVER